MCVVNKVCSLHVFSHGMALTKMNSQPKPEPKAAAASSSSATPATPAPAASFATPAPPAAPAASAPAPAAAPATPTPAARSSDANYNDPNALAMGEQRTEAIANMEAMGFERSQIDAAMRAAFYNPDRAVEYLLNVSGRPKGQRETWNFGRWIWQTNKKTQTV